jgi:hypothetical protein
MLAFFDELANQLKCVVQTNSVKVVDPILLNISAD